MNKSWSFWFIGYDSDNPDIHRHKVLALASQDDTLYKPLNNGS